MKHKKLTLALIASTVAAMILVATLSVYAYFTTRVYVYTDAGEQVAHVGMNLQLLFGKLDDEVSDTEIDLPNYQVVDGVVVFQEKVTLDTSAPWGTAQNPYVISETRHLQNLSALQNVGYFDMLYIAENFGMVTVGEGESATQEYGYIKGSASIPYFLVCDSLGRPVTIDGTKLTSSIKPIGSAEHPFIGVIGGAFVDGETTVFGADTPKDTTDDKISTTSAIHGFKVQTNTNQTDVGLFGYVGFLGKEPTADELQNASDTAKDEQEPFEPQFEGVFSSIQDVLISDVSVKVNALSATDAISELFMPFWEKFFGNNDGVLGEGEVLHRFSYTGKNVPTGTVIPHETHHIGIFAGHVSYALIDNISVYYSNDNTYAIDLTALDLVNDNYYSASGILGMMYNMNCTIRNEAEKNCVVLMGTGMSPDGVGSGSEGTGTGGGSLSGNGRGYVTAAEIFSDFNYVAVKEDANNELLWNYRVGGTWTYNAILILQKKNGEYTFLDGTTKAVVANAVVSTEDGSKSWQNYFVLKTVNDNTAGEDMLRYVTPTGSTITECVLTGNNCHGQTIWKYSAGGDGIWHYGIRVFKDGDVYTLEDGTTVVFDGKHIVRENEDNTTTVWANFFVTDNTAGATTPHYMYDSAANKNWTVSTFERKPMTLIEAVNADGENLCIQWMRDRILSFITPNPEPTGLYYFYDGVFTFALSDETDSIRDTWMNDEAPTMYLGADQDSAWEVNAAKGNKAVVALMKPITSNSEMDDAINNKRQFYISAVPVTGGKDIMLASLVNDGKNTTPGSIAGTKLEMGDDTLRGQLYESYHGGLYTSLPKVPTVGATVDPEMDVDIEDLKTPEWWDDYDILNIGRTSTTQNLTDLRTKYNVVSNEVSNTYYYFYADTGAYVVPSNGTITQYQSWDGYFFYTWSSASVSSGLIPDRRYTITYYYQPGGAAQPIELGKSSHLASNQLWDDFQYSYVDCSAYIQIQTASTGTTENLYNQYKDPNTGEWVSVSASARVLDLETEEWGAAEAVPMLNYQASPVVFHGTGGATVMNGSIVSKDTGVDISYYYWDVVSEEYYAPGNNNPLSEDNIENLEENGAVLLNRYPCYSFSDSSQTSYLQFLRQYTGRFIVNYGERYSMWAGTAAQRNAFNETDNRLYENGYSQNSVLVFESGKDYCYIRYAVGNSSQYVSYNTDSTTFGGVTTYSATAPIKLYVYVIEGIIDMDFGINTFIPKDNNAPHFSADQIVLWPQTTLKAAHTLVDRNGNPILDENEQEQTMSAGIYSNSGPFSDAAQVPFGNNYTNYTPASPNSPDPTYSVIELADLQWGTSGGYFLGSKNSTTGVGYGLKQKFQMADQAGFGDILNLLGGNWEYNAPAGGYSQLVAPIGSNGVEANIPKGCVAFRVNAGGTQTVRIIVAVPVTDKYVGSQAVEDEFELDMVDDYYIGVWNVGASGDDTTQSFSKEDALEKFELPRSYTFSLDDTPATMGAGHYVNVQYGGQYYRTYLNGDCFLVAYEFFIDGGDDGGVFVIGSAHGDDDSESTKDVPMEIVHFSVSGTASAGRDGVTGNQLGAIDFVYSDVVNTGTADAPVNTNTIITVDRISGFTGGTTNANGENYANYYASQCMMHTNNTMEDSGTSDGLVKINKGTIWIRRYLNGTQTTMTYKVMAGSEGTDATAVSQAFGVTSSTANSDLIVDRNAPQTLEEQDNS